MFNSPRANTSSTPGMSNWQGYMQQYVQPWAQIQQLLAGNANLEALLAALSATGVGDVADPASAAAAASAAAPAPARDRPRGGGGRGRDNGFVGGGYAQPGQINANTGSWGNVLGALNGNQADKAARRAVRRAMRGVDVGDDGVYVEEPKERTRSRERSRTSRDGTTTTTTSVNISRNGGTAISDQSGGDGNRKRRKRY